MSWIKIEISTPDKPEIYQIADALSIDPDAAFGKLFRVWAWFDQHTENGNAPSVTKTFIDRCSGVSGFAEAMKIAGWLVEEDGEVIMPNFGYHTGESAKKRALTAKRAAKHRENNNEKSNVLGVTNALPREEKKRSKEKNKQKRNLKTSLPDGFGISEGVKAWAEKNGHTRLNEHLDNFVLACQAKGYKYANWDSALKGAIRNNWAKLETKTASGSNDDYDHWRKVGAANGVNPEPTETNRDYIARVRQHTESRA